MSPSQPSAPEPGQHPSKPLPPALDLPPVDPPSAKFIVQLFLIPLGIVIALVAGLMLVYMFFGRIATGGRDASEYVHVIRSGNENRRWRAAYELASLIHNDSRLSHDPALLGELTDLLEQQLERPDSKKAELPRYLALTLGVFQTLKTESASGRKPDPIATLVKALDPSQAAEVRAAAAISLSRLADQFPTELAESSAPRALIDASKADDPEVRQRAAYALGYFTTPESQDALRLRVRDPDRTVRFNAAAALARKGDLAAKPAVREMLSTRDLEQVIEHESKSEQDRRIEGIQLEALWSLQASLKSQNSQLAQSLRTDIEKLTTSQIAAVRVEAKSLLKSLPNTP